MENADPYQLAAAFAKRLEIAPRFKEQVKEGEQVIQFEPSGGEPFYLEVKPGGIAIGKGKKYPPDFPGGLYIRGDQASLRSLLLGELSLAEAIYHHKIRIAGYRNREPVMVWFSRLLRLGLGIRD